MKIKELVVKAIYFLFHMLSCNFQIHIFLLRLCRLLSLKFINFGEELCNKSDNEAVKEMKRIGFSSHPSQIK
jgi:hypothetical protein